jgi:uncharacterized low-complexity protein
MSTKTTRKAVAVAIGATFVTSLAAVHVANAAENPFSAKPLASGYQVADAAKGKEGQCGAKDKAKEAQCGANKDKAKEKARKEGQCGEAKCGANKDKK